MSKVIKVSDEVYEFLDSLVKQRKELLLRQTEREIPVSFNDVLKEYFMI